MDGTPVRYGWRGKAMALFFATLVVGIPGALFASGLMTGSWFGIGAAIVLLAVMLAGPLRSMIARPFAPAFVVTASGLRLHGGALLPWADVKEAVFFNYSGTPHFGVRLRDGVTSVGGMTLAQLKERNLEYLIHRMVFAAITSTLATTPDELTRLFRRHGVAIRVNRKLVDLGDEEQV